MLAVTEPERPHAGLEGLERPNRLDDLLELGREAVSLLTGVAHEHRQQGGIGRECQPIEVVGKGFEVDEAERLLDCGDLGGRHVITVMERTPPRLSN